MFEILIAGRQSHLVWGPSTTVKLAVSTYNTSLAIRAPAFCNETRTLRIVKFGFCVLSTLGAWPLHPSTLWSTASPYLSIEARPAFGHLYHNLITLDSLQILCSDVSEFYLTIGWTKENLLSFVITDESRGLRILQSCMTTICQYVINHLSEHAILRGIVLP